MRLHCRTQERACWTLWCTAGGGRAGARLLLKRQHQALQPARVQQLGLHAALYGVWDSWDQNNRLEVGEYRVRGWVTKFDIPGEPIEYDAGVEEVDDNE